MEIEFDPAKNEKNFLERGLPFTLAHDFDFTTALLDIDARKNYGETRYRALGLLNGRLHALIFVLIADGIRVISLRKANKREVDLYERRTQS